MASIEQQIRDAVPKQLERAATFDNKREMKGPGCTPLALVQRAMDNLHNARTDLKTVPMLPLVRQDLVDAANLCALALSLLPEPDHKEADGG